LTEIEKNLEALAERINAEHRACEVAVNSALAHAMTAGEMLSAAKIQLPHGAFGPWLAENFAGSDRTARAYMRVSSRREELEAKRQSSATMSLDGALKALAAPSGPTKLALLEAGLAKSLSGSRASSLAVAQNLDETRRGRFYEARGHATLAEYVERDLAEVFPFPLPYEAITGEDGELLPVFELAEVLHSWNMARVVDPLLREDV
jgi:hypothetical protein